MGWINIQNVAIQISSSSPSSHPRYYNRLLLVIHHTGIVIPQIIRKVLHGSVFVGKRLKGVGNVLGNIVIDMECVSIKTDKIRLHHSRDIEVGVVTGRICILVVAINDDPAFRATSAVQPEGALDVFVTQTKVAARRGLRNGATVGGFLLGADGPQVAISESKESGGLQGS